MKDDVYENKWRLDLADKEAYADYMTPEKVQARLDAREAGEETRDQEEEMFEEVFGITSYNTKERNAGKGPLRVAETLSFREDMYSLLFISMVKPVYMKFCEENTESLKIEKICNEVINVEEEEGEVIDGYEAVNAPGDGEEDEAEHEEMEEVEAPIDVLETEEEKKIKIVK